MGLASPPGGYEVWRGRFYIVEHLGSTQQGFFEVPLNTSTPSTHSERAGWPLWSLESRCTFADGAWQDVPPDQLRGSAFVSWRSGIWCGWQSSSGQFATLPLACWPLWPGFAIDTAIFSAGWSLPVLLPVGYRTARRRFRVSRGMCGACGYDLKGSPGGVCPECGHTGGAQP
jgi:hypothetical protein